MSRQGFLPRLAASLGLAIALALAGCGGGSTPAPGSGSPGDSPTPAASIDGDGLAAAFVAILSDPALHATVAQQATATAEQGGDILELRTTMTGSLALPDVDLEVAVETEGQVTRFKLVVVGDQAYVDLGEGWVEAPPGSVDTAELGKAFVVVTDAGDVEYAGTQDVDGRTLYHLVATRPLPYTPAGFEGTGTGTGTIDDLDAYVEADGTPVRIELSFSAEGTTDAGATTVTGTTEIRFSDVGGNQEIVAPTVAPTVAPSVAPESTPSAAP
jgi:hypothetical protein